MNWICKLDESFGTLKVEANNFGDVDRINREQWNSLLTAVSFFGKFGNPILLSILLLVKSTIIIIISFIDLVFFVPFVVILLISYPSEL